MRGSCATAACSSAARSTATPPWLSPRRSTGRSKPVTRAEAGESGRIVALSTPSSCRPRRFARRSRATGSPGGGGLWVADSPHLLFEMLETFERAGLRSRDSRLSGRAAVDLGAEVHPAAGGSGRGTGLAPGRRLLGRRARAQRLALALSLRRRGPRHGHRSAAARRNPPDRDGGCHLRLVGLRAGGRGGGGRDRR